MNGSVQKSHVCSMCQKSYNRRYSLNRHLRTCGNLRQYPCDECEVIKSSEALLKRHKQVHVLRRCCFCDAQFREAASLRRHEEMNATRPNKRHLPPQDLMDLPDDMEPSLRQMHLENWDVIKTYLTENDHQEVYNIRLEESVKKLDGKLWYLFYRQDQMFKINVNFGVIFKDRVSKELRYENDCDQTIPFLVKDQADFEKFLETVRNIDWLKLVKWKSSRWMLYFIPNVTFYVSKINHDLR